jgi:hypothetical protein
MQIAYHTHHIHVAAAPHVSVNVILVQQKMDIFFHTHCNHKTAEEAAV